MQDKIQEIMGLVDALNVECIALGIGKMASSAETKAILGDEVKKARASLESKLRELVARVAELEGTQPATIQEPTASNLRQVISDVLDKWHIESGDICHYEALTDELFAAITKANAKPVYTHPTQQGLDAADTVRLNWLDSQVKNHAVHNGFLWQEGGWESDRGLVCAIQGKKHIKTVRQAIDAALAAQAKQGDQTNG